MANIITEVFVSLDGLNFIKLDLYKDESLNLKFKQKDLQDLSKIFAPFSQGFSFPASPKNRAAFGFFGDTEVIKINTEAKFAAKLYTSGILNQTGYIKLEFLAYKNQKPTDFSGSFASNMTNLKEKIGDDYLSDITDEPVLVKWDYEGVQNMVKSRYLQVVDGVNVRYFVPLVSINRVWGFDLTENSTLLDNIAYNETTPLDSFNLIRPEELRPVVYYSTILEFIKKKYGLTIISPLESREEYKDLTVWCNSERIISNDYTLLPILNAFGSLKWYDSKRESIIPDPKKYTIAANTVTDTFTVTRLLEPFTASEAYIEKAFQFRVLFNGVSITGDSETTEVNIQYVRASDDVVFKTETFGLDGNTFNCVTQIEDEFFGGSATLEFYIKVQFMQPTSWSGCEYRIFFRFYKDLGILNLKTYAWYYYDSLINNNSAFVNTDSIDLIKSLPKIKVVDFLASHFKAFNISVFDTSPDNDELYWLTPEDIASENNVYSRAVLNYTGYADIKSRTKEKPNDYNYYNFKHATSNYFSNKKYLEAFGLEYGQILYPETKPTEPSEFKVETSFSIVPPVTVKGATGLITAYGFKSDSPEVIETGETRYSPNYDELTVFYEQGSTECLTVGFLGIKTVEVAPWVYEKQFGVYPLTGYIKVMPVNKNGYSFGFSVLNINGTDYLNSLYLRGYSVQTLRLLDPNVLSQSFNLILPPNEIYLNNAATFGGAGKPLGFRLQNDIIIGENKFSIVDAIIDVTTGKAQMKLLNY